MATPLAFQAWQWWVIAVAWLVFFFAPSFWMFKKAKADGDDTPLVWAILVAVGSFVGILEYRHHRSILKRRAARAAKKEE